MTLALERGVTVRITLLEDRPPRRIRVDGRLTGDEIRELEQLIGTDPRTVFLELADLRSVDAAALAVLRRLRAEGIGLCGVPRHLSWRIEEEES